MTRRGGLALALVMTLPVTALAADDGETPQDPPVRASRAADDGLPLVGPGLRVKLLSEIVTGRVVGRIIEADTRGLRVLTDGGVPVSVPFETLTRLEASFTQRRHTREGLAAGIVLGVLVGVLAEVDEYACHADDSTAFCSRGEALAGGSGGGALLGAGIGALVRTDRWQALSLERLRLSLAPGVASGRRASIRLALSW